MRNALRLSVADLGDFVRSSALELDDGVPRAPLAFVNLSGDVPPDAVDVAHASHVVLVGVAPDGVPPQAAGLAAALACTLVAGPASATTAVSVADLDAAIDVLFGAVTRSPRAATALGGLLRTTARLPVVEGLVAESLAYSMLLAGPEFARWRASNPVKPEREFADPAVLVSRDGATLHVTINRPLRHNAFSRFVRDGLVDAFDLVLYDDTITDVRLTGNGASFCSGGDLDEFGSTPDVATAHLIRLDRSVASRLDRCRDRVQVVLHGACIGAGIEISSFAGRVDARADAYFQLPELAMGLVPGAGGTVGITRRIGRWRTTYLALTGEPIDVETGLAWGLIDGRAED